jgi:hypothetical protein
MPRPENPWFTADNRQPSLGLAGGPGIIHEPDDIRDDNPPANPNCWRTWRKN